MAISVLASMSLEPLDIAIALANEGVPTMAIARSVKISSCDLREQLHEARADGRLVQLPCEDWPPGFPRDQRSLQLSRTVVGDKNAILLSIQRTFGLTPTEARVLLLMLQNEALHQERVDLAPVCLHVHVHRIRQKLASHGLTVRSVWGVGYELVPESRRKAMDAILAAGPAD
jgi:hypothetical protein